MKRSILIENIIFSDIPSDLRKKANPVRFAECSRRQQQNALQYLAPECSPDNAVAFVDMTTWNTGKQGVIFAADGIYAILDNDPFLMRSFPGSLKYENINSITIPDKNPDRLLLYYYKDSFRVLLMPHKYLEFCFAAINKIAEAIMEDKAITGSMKDEYNCALMFDEGRYSPVNKEKAFFWYKKAALQGEREAQFQYARKHQLGEGTHIDIKEAENWYEIAAKQEHPEAQFCYGKLCADRGTIEGKKEAFYWYQRAGELGHDEASRSADAMEFELDRIRLGKLREQAEQGNADAQFDCGEMYRQGKGTEINFSESIYWYEKAALQNHLLAAAQCSIMYKAGEGTAVDDEKSLYWCEKAATQSNEPFTQYLCGSMYDSRSESESDKKRAMYWYEKAAMQGDIKAQFQCGWHYSKGEGVPEDKEKAFYWYKKAAEQGDSASQFNTGLYYSKGMGTENDEKKALYWYERAAMKGNIKAQYNCGHRYHMGIGTWKNEQKAVHWLTEAASKGHSKASDECREWSEEIYENVSLIYYWKKEEKYNTALQQFEIAAKLGHDLSQYCLASMYYEGMGTVQDVDMAISWYEKAAEQNNIQAQNKLGDIYAKKRFYSSACKWYKKAANNGDEYAQFQCASMYYYMEAYEEALEWLKPLADSGNPKAQYNCGVAYEHMHMRYEARKWYKEATANGSKMAELALEGY